MSQAVVLPGQDRVDELMVRRAHRRREPVRPKVYQLLLALDVDPRMVLVKLSELALRN